MNEDWRFLKAAGLTFAGLWFGAMLALVAPSLVEGRLIGALQAFFVIMVYWGVAFTMTSAPTWIVASAIVPNLLAWAAVSPGYHRMHRLAFAGWAAVFGITVGALAAMTISIAQGGFHPLFLIGPMGGGALSRCRLRQICTARVQSRKISRTRTEQWQRFE